MDFRFKLTKKIECTVLTWPARIVILIIVTGLLLLFFLRFPFFLSKDKPVYGKYLVLDGQMPDYSVEIAIQVFNKYGYDKVITTGGEIPAGYYIAGKKTMAEMTYATFLEMNFDSTKIIAIPGNKVFKDRTYSSALTLKEYFRLQNITSAKIDLIAIGCHSRRSRILFEMAMEENFEIGVFAVEDKSYELSKWWKTSKGVRTFISETIAYFYVVLFFYP